MPSTLGGINRSSNALATTTSPAGVIVREAAAAVGGEDSPQAIAAGYRGLKDFVDKANTRHLFRFLRREQADQALTTDQTEITVPGSCFAISAVQIVDSDGKVYKTLDEVNFQEFQHTHYPQTSTRETSVWYMLNGWDGETITVYPAISSTLAADYKSRLTYYIRVKRIESEDSFVVGPEELDRPMRLHCIAWITEELDSTNVARWRDKKREADQALKDFFAQDQREDASIRSGHIKYARNPRNIRRWRNNAW